VNVAEIFAGSDGGATKALYAQLMQRGPVGEIAVNLLRASKASERAKVYRGGVRGEGSYRSMAYGRKDWAIGNLSTVLAMADGASLPFGWGRDDATPGFEWVLYVDIPTGQVSFHTRGRHAGPDYAGVWDGVRGASADRIVRWCQQVLDEYVPAIGSVVAQRREPAPIAGELWCEGCKVWWTRRAMCPRCRQPLRVKAKPVVLPELRPGVRAEWDEPVEAAR